MGLPESQTCVVAPGVRRLAASGNPVYLTRVAAEEPRRQAGKAVLLLDNDRDAVRRCIRERDAGCITAGADDAPRAFVAGDPRYAAPGAKRPAQRLPVFPGSRTIERMQIEKLVGKLGCWQHASLDASLRANEQGTYRGIDALHGARDGEAGIEMPARATSGK